MKKTIAIIDDEEDILELVSLHLHKNSFTPVKFADASSFLQSMSRQVPDLIILDLMLPDMDGTEVCKTIRNNPEWKKVPVIMLTAKQDEIDKIIGLELGADDYMTKPFSPRELIARVKAVLRRYAEIDNGDSSIINIFNEIFIDTQKYEVYNKENKKIDLTTTEFKLLKILAENPGWVFSREKLLKKIWGEEKYVIDRTIDVHIKHLREKLGDGGKFIINIRGVGYKLGTKE
ncbi:MAG: response regulator transcription factor [Spirochaetes bacterium]|nr:response regulator transcription factor [Spirochaetota bacterium]